MLADLYPERFQIRPRTGRKREDKRRCLASSQIPVTHHTPRKAPSKSEQAIPRLPRPPILNLNHQSQNPAIRNLQNPRDSQHPAVNPATQTPTAAPRVRRAAASTPSRRGQRGGHVVFEEVDEAAVAAGDEDALRAGGRGEGCCRGGMWGRRGGRWARRRWWSHRYLSSRLRPRPLRFLDVPAACAVWR